jgi:hypothetical protein
LECVEIGVAVDEAEADRFAGQGGEVAAADGRRIKIGLAGPTK